MKVSLRWVLDKIVSAGTPIRACRPLEKYLVTAMGSTVPSFQDEVVLAVRSVAVVGRENLPLEEYRCPAISCGAGMKAMSGE